MKIVYVIPGIDRTGGAEKQVTLLASRMIRRGHSVTLAVLSGSGGEHAARLREGGVQFLSLHMCKGLIDPRGWIAWQRFIRWQRPEIIHAHLPHATWFTRWSRLFAPVPVLLETLHTSATGSAIQRLSYCCGNWLSDHTTAVSTDVAHAYVDARIITAQRTSVVPNGVDLNQWTNNADRKDEKTPDAHIWFEWFAAGRLEPVKDYACLLNAMALLPSCARLSIAGSGRMRDALQQQAIELEIQERVRFLGEVTDVGRYMSMADAVVLASRGEGLPTVLLEAGACGLPVVATDVAGSQCAVVDGVTGLLAVPGNPSGLATAMRRLMNMSPIVRKSLGLNGRARIQAEFNIETITRDWEDLYKCLLAGSVRRRRWATPYRLATQTVSNSTSI